MKNLCSSAVIWLINKLGNYYVKNGKKYPFCLKYEICIIDSGTCNYRSISMLKIKNTKKIKKMIRQDNHKI